MRRYGIVLSVLIFVEIIGIIRPVTAFAQKERQNGPDELRVIKQKLDYTRDYKGALALCTSAVKNHHGDVDFLFLLGKAYFMTHNYSQAQKVFDQVIQKSPNYKDAYMASVNVQLAVHNNWKAMVYVNKGLAYFSGDRDFELKKLSIFLQQANRNGANAQVEHLIRLFPTESAVMKTCVNYYNGQGDLLLRQGNLSQASVAYGKALELDPGNIEALKGSSSVRQKSGDDQSTLNMLNRALIQHPGSYDFMIKKASILLDQKRYPEAREMLQLILKKSPGDAKARSLLSELNTDAAQYYKSEDPYFLYSDILQQSPGNTEAMGNVISIALNRGNLDEALFWIDKSLKKNPSDKKRLFQKLTILQRQQKYGAASVVAEKLLKLNPGNRDIKEELIQLYQRIGHDYAGEQLYDNALDSYRKIFKLDPRNKEALNSSINILSAKKDYSAALQLVDNTLQLYPKETDLLTLKASLLQDDEQFEEAMLLWEKLSSQEPQNKKFTGNYIEASLAFGRQLMQVSDYDPAAAVYAKILTIQPDNKEALNNIQNIELAKNKQGSQTAIVLSDQALKYYPHDLGFLMKKSDALFRSHHYPEASNLTDSLMKRYPYNLKLRDIYLEQLHKMAVVSRQHGDSTASINTYNRILAVNASDSTALLELANLYRAGGNYSQSLKVTGNALSYYPGNATFLLKRAQVLEQMKQYREAFAAADSVALIYPERKSFRSYSDYLLSRTFKNMISLSYLNSQLDSSRTANIATLQYSFYGKKGIYSGKLNFAGRGSGTGLQGEFEMYYNHSPRWYSYLDLAVANKLVFPNWKVAYSIFHSFAKGWEGELGVRVLKFTTISSYSGVVSLAKSFGDFWVNFRNYTTFLSGKTYEAETLTARQYLNNKTDFFYANLGYGNSPDEFSRSYQLNMNIKYQTYSIGGGFQMMFNYRNIISINATWFNQKTYESLYRNQYDVYVSFARKF